MTIEDSIRSKVQVHATNLKRAETHVHTATAEFNIPSKRVLKMLKEESFYYTMYIYI